jgi:hypothetical protein
MAIAAATSAEIMLLIVFSLFGLRPRRSHPPGVERRD